MARDVAKAPQKSKIWTAASLVALDAVVVEWLKEKDKKVREAMLEGLYETLEESQGHRWKEDNKRVPISEIEASDID